MDSFPGTSITVWLIEMNRTTQLRMTRNNIKKLLARAKLLNKIQSPGFRSLRICADLQDFSAGFCKNRCTES